MDGKKSAVVVILGFALLLSVLCGYFAGQSASKAEMEAMCRRAIVKHEATKHPVAGFPGLGAVARPRVLNDPTRVDAGRVGLLEEKVEDLEMEIGRLRGMVTTQEGHISRLEMKVR